MLFERITFEKRLYGKYHPLGSREVIKWVIDTKILVVSKKQDRDKDGNGIRKR